MITGRKDELAQLSGDYITKKSSLIAVYGRRRIGKSALIKYYASNKPFWSFEALEGETTNKQIEHFVSQLSKYVDDELLAQIKFANWSQVFKYLTEKIKIQNKKQTKLVILFDEFQWMAANQSSLVSLVKYFWDQEWKILNIQLILCGSIASFMIDKVIKSKALYGRIDLELHIIELKPFELKNFFDNKRSLHEILRYILLIGGVPKYFELIDTRQSFDKNIQRLAFTSSGYLFNDYEKIFYGQFKEYQTYEKIIRFISGQPRNLESIAKHLGMQSSGGIKRYLRNLEAARFIKSYTPVQKTKTNIIKYKIFDEYLIFYSKFIQPNRKAILNGSQKNMFQLKIKPKWNPWLGIAFENFCLKYNAVICEALEITEYVEEAGPYFERNDTDGFQIDLLIKRNDHIWTLCECKYYEAPLGVEIIKEVERKVKLLKLPRGITLEKALITINGVEPAVETLEYFDRILKIEDLFLSTDFHR